MNRRIPGVLWVALITLGVATIGKLLAIVHFGPAVLIDVAVCVVLLVGLYRGHKWAYVLTIFIVFAKLVVTLMMGAVGGALAVFLFDCLVLVPVLMSKRYFWGRTCPNTLCGNRNNQDARFCARCGAELAVHASASEV